jgi:hypothetical protein
MVMSENSCSSSSSMFNNRRLPILSERCDTLLPFALS